MKYRFNTAHYKKIFAVPSSITERHIRLAGAAQLKVLLLLLSNDENEIEDEELSKIIGISVADVSDAMRYWLDAGLVFDENSTESDIITTVEKTEEPDKKEVVKPAVVNVLERKDQRLTRQEALAVAKDNEEVAWLLKEAQQKLGRPLNNGEIASYVSMVTQDGLPCAVILMIIQYAVSNSKTSIHYIDKIAANWTNEEINTVEKAENYLKTIEITGGYWRKIQNAFLMEYRQPSKQEKIYAERWIGEWHFTQAMLKKAYDICVDSTGKMTFNYINKVLDNWHKNNISTPEDVDNEALTRKNKKNKKNEEKNNGSFDTSELYDMFWKPEDK